MLSNSSVKKSVMFTAYLLVICDALLTVTLIENTSQIIINRLYKAKFVQSLTVETKALLNILFTLMYGQSILC